MTDEHTDQLAIALGELAASATHHERVGSEQPRACPVCGETMELVQQFDVVIDVCEAHGVWLDQGEQATILERTYWHRRELEQPPRADASRQIDHTRKKFKTSLNRVAGLIGI